MTDKYSAGPESRVPSFLVTNCAGLTVASMPLGRRHADAAHPGDVRHAATRRPAEVRARRGKGLVRSMVSLCASGGGALRTFGAAVLACAVLLTGLLGAGSAAAQTNDITTPTSNRDGSDTLWTATLTVEEYQVGTVSYFGYERSGSKGALSSDAFAIGSIDYPIAQLLDIRTPTPTLTFALPTSGFPAERSNWVLHLDEVAFPISAADSLGLTIIDWNNPGLNWTDGKEVAVRLVRLNKPTAPRNLHAKGHSTTQINLSWRAPAKSGGADITGYKIEVSTDGGDSWANLDANTASTDTTYSHTGLSSGDTRHYRVSAINAAGTGPVSSVADATAEATAPGVASAVVERTNSLVVVLEFDELVDTTSSPDKSAFAVKVGKSREVTVTSFTITDAGQFGRVGLASSVRSGQTVRLSYTKPGANPLKATMGTDEIASFTNYSVTNEVSTDFPILSMQGAEAYESGDPDNPETTMTFTVSVDTEPDFPVGVHYETEDVTATGGASCSGSSPPDYISTEGRLTLGPGESSKVVEVTVCDDSVPDTGETFRLVLNSTQLHEPISALGEIGPEGKSYPEDAETGSLSGTILNDESTTEISIAAAAAYAEEGNDMVFTLTRAGDAAEALTVPVTVEETGAMLDGDAPESVTFAAQSREAELRIATENDSEDETDSTVTATVQSGTTWQLAEEASSAELTVLDNDAAPVNPVSGVTVWSANMTVVEYGPRSIGAGTAGLFSNQSGSAGLRAKWLWYDPATRELRIGFDAGLDDAESLTLHVGGVSLGFPENSGGNSSFTLEDVDIAWTDGETAAARISKPSTEAVSTDATLASLAVEDVTLSPDFDAAVLVYRAAVDAETNTVTVAASANDGGAAVTYDPAGDADTALEDHQVAVPEGETLVTLTVTAADGKTVRRYRVVVARAAANTAPTGLPAISGTPRVGVELTASESAIEDGDGIENAAFEWQWLVNDGTEGAEDTEIAGAAVAGYTPKPGDVGKTLKVRVTFTDDKGTEEVLTSVATAAVAATVPDAPGGFAAATAEGREGELDVSWTAPASDGGAAISGYKVQWKSGSEDYDATATSTRQAVVTGLTHTITGLTDGVTYTVRIVAVNDTGDGAEAEVSAEVRDRVAPVLSKAAVDATSLTLTYSEALDEDSSPAAGVFAVTVAESARTVDAVSVSGSAVTLTLALPCPHK